MPPRARRGFDLAGAVTLTASMLLLVFTVVEAPDAGWASCPHASAPWRRSPPC